LGGSAGANTGGCGNGRLDPGEECDDGNLDSQDACSASCKNAVCGDALLWRGHETCDNGTNNGIPGGSCSSTCRIRTRDISLGNETSCALGYNAGIKCWGYGAVGSLGNGKRDNVGDAPGELGMALAPIDLEGDPNVFAVAVGMWHACMATLGGVRCWGYNADGELGLGDTDNRGDDPGEMGSALPFVDLGTNFFPTGIAAGYFSTCAVSTYATLKCWGANYQGQLGLGDTQYRGNLSGQMGNALPVVDLGTNVMVKDVTVGATHACALVNSGQIKCWGDNRRGELGLGDTVTRGDGPGEMGDALPFVNLGTGEVAVKVVAGGNRTCAELERHAVKCWGDNSSGELGLEDLVARGTAPDQMGDALPTVDVGTGREVVDLALGDGHVCVLLDDGTVKCWGVNNDGQLGVPPGGLDRGGRPGDMGDNLLPIDLGGDTAELVATGAAHTCAKLHSQGVVKCWGSNGLGELGLGDTNARGDDPNEMGANLPAVDVDF
jgi:cysteine-rich repeat protein